MLLHHTLMTADLNQNTRLRKLLTLPAICLPLLACFFYFVWFPGTAFGNAFYVGVKIFLLVWPMVAVWGILREQCGDYSRPIDHRGSLLPGAAFGVLVVGLMFGLMKLTPMGDFVYGNGERIAQRIEDLGVKRYYIAFALFVSFIHAALEEYFWRFFAFGQLRKLMSLTAAVIVAAVGFAAHHIVVMTQFVDLPLAFVLGGSVGLGGAVWSILYHRYNSLAGAWLSHMIIDLGIMWIGWEILTANG